MKGLVIGLILVIVAYIAGLFVLVSILTALVILVIAVITRYLAPGRSLKKKLIKKLTVILIFTKNSGIICG